MVSRLSKVLPALFALSLVPSLALADEPVTSVVKRNVEENLVKPLVQRENERSKFSRARMPPRERRVRVTQDKPSLDGSGREFYAFAIDVRFGGEWKENDVVGCAYPKGGALFVKLGDAYRRHEILLGTASDPVPGVCVAPKPQT